MIISVLFTNEEVGEIKFEKNMLEMAKNIFHASIHPQNGKPYSE